uniref:Growth hormone-inducible transmembrane protein-like n=1 Tax=Sinocyclocheilus anshuiensis TaxID=1608454 RepID=A0A671NHE4_9TELE
MWVSRLSCLRSVPVPVLGLRSALSPAPGGLMKSSPALIRPQQGYSTKTRLGFRRSKTSKEQVQEAATNTHVQTRTFDSMGRIVLAGGAAVGLGALCYYGLGMSNEMGAIEKAVIWPQYVKDRIHSTYMYFAGSVGLTALSAVAVSRTPALMGLVMRGSWLVR